MRTIDAPGVEIKEIDKSQYAQSPTGTAVLALGFAASGEDYTPMQFTSKNAWTNYYGEPTNEAERYFYNACMEVINQNGKIYSAKLPYDNGAADSLASFGYKVATATTEISGIASVLTSKQSTLNTNTAYVAQFKDEYLATHAVTDITDRAKVSELTAVTDLSGLKCNTSNRSDGKTVASNTALTAVYGNLTTTDFNATRSPADALEYLSASDIPEYAELISLDSNISACLKISADENAVTMKLDDLDLLRTGETTVGANEIKIVDITRKQYGKVDNGSVLAGTPSELVGIVPVITTAANAAAVQTMITVGKERINAYETLSAITTLSAAEGGPNTFAEGALAMPIKTGDNLDETTVSKLAAGYFPALTFGDDGHLVADNLKKIGVVVFKTYTDTANGGKINFSPAEAFVGSLDKNAKDPTTGASVFIDKVVNTRSELIELYSNCFVTTATKSAFDAAKILILPPAKAASLGFYEKMCAKKIALSKLLTGISTAFSKVDNINELDIDIVVDAGLTNIGQYLKSVFGSDGSGEYDPTTAAAAAWKLRKADDASTWKAVANKIINFCSNQRRDCVALIDGCRPLSLTGNQKIVRPSRPTNTIDANIIPNIKYMTGLNTSYAALYGVWYQIMDEFSGDYFWLPPSVKAAGACVYTDTYFNYWDAPAGLTRGLVSGAVDVSFSPSMKQAGSLYNKQINYAVNYPSEGVVIEGQKTLQTAATAFDRLNVRRLFLRLERQTYKAARYFVDEGNTAYTRQRFVDTVAPLFETAKVGGGIYDYMIVCDETNNTADVIDNNEMRVKIGIKPTKTAEFILIDFIALSTGGSFDEM